MKRVPPVITSATQALSFSRRAWLLGTAQAGVGALLAARMGWLAIAENEHFTTLSESNRVNTTLVPPRRGWIVDRHGVPIANNRTDFRVDLIPERLQDPERELALLARLLQLTPEEVARVKLGPGSRRRGSSRCRSPRTSAGSGSRRCRCASPSCPASRRRAASRVPIRRARRSRI